MFALSSVASIATAFLIPFWWGVGLFILVLLGDMSTLWRPRVSRLFDWLERTGVESPNEPAASRTVAA